LIRLGATAGLFGFLAASFLTTPVLSVLSLRQWTVIRGIAVTLAGAISRLLVANFGSVGLSSACGLAASAIWAMVRYSQPDTLPWSWWRYLITELFGSWGLYGPRWLACGMLGRYSAELFFVQEKNRGSGGTAPNSRSRSAGGLGPRSFRAGCPGNVDRYRIAFQQPVCGP
jgi:hypothetical protein